MYPESKGRELTERLLYHALAEAEMPDLKIMRTEKGKPYVQSAAEQDQADRPLGIDLQHGRKMDPAKISARYFAEEEAELVRKLGAAAFFRLWTRKEAYSKYTGNGLADVMRGISVLDRNDVEFLDFQWEKDIYCSCCVKKE